MTDQKPDLSAVKLEDRDRTQSGKAMCQECPFKEKNRGREHSFNHYQNANLTGYWRSVSQEGSHFNCHMFAPSAYAYDQADIDNGFKHPTNLGNARECAGTVAMLRRELEVLATYPTWGDYKKDRPTGLSQKVVQRLQQRLNGEVDPPLNYSDFVKPEDVIHPEDWIETSDLAWKFSRHTAMNMLLIMSVIAPETNECDCRTCTNHEQVHAGKELVTSQGFSVTVDADLHPLLQALAKAGAESTESCVNLHEAVSRLAPGEVGALTNLPAGDVNYRPVMVSKNAFIRLSNQSAAAKAFILAANNIPSIGITTYKQVTQLVFPTRAIPALVRIAEVVAGVAQSEDKTQLRPIAATSKQDLARRLLEQRKGMKR